MAENTGADATSLVQWGAGGKLRKPPSRRPTTTPYSRPQQNQAQRGRWISKLVDPAYRLIAGSANLIFPSFFSKSEAFDPPPFLEDDLDKTSAEEEQNAGDNDGNSTLNDVASGSADGAGTSRAADQLKSNSDVEAYEQQKSVDVSNYNEISEIEQLIKDKRFSRDEIKRLLEIIHSRAADIPDIEQEKKYPSMIARDVGGSTLAFEYSRKSIEEKKEGLNRGTSGTEKIQERKYTSPIVRHVGEPGVTLETSRKSTEDKNDLNRAIWGTSTPLVQSTPQNDVGATPIDIARAYMENRTLELGFGSKSLILKDNGVASKSLVPSSSPKSSTCWPGAMVQDQHAYSTPLSQKGGFGLHNFPRTPYSRTIYSKSRSKSIQLQGNSDRHPSMMQTPLQQSQTSKSKQVNSRGYTLDNSRGSIGPIRRIGRKVGSEIPKGSPYFESSLRSPLVDNLNVSEGIFSGVKNNLEKERTSSSSIFFPIDSRPQSSEVSVPTVPSHSSQMAQRILEHLDRNPPTPKEKLNELKLATSWRKAHSPSATTSMTNKHSNSVFKVPSQEASNEASVTINNDISASDAKVSCTVSTNSNNAVPSLVFGKTQDSQLLSAHKDGSNFTSNDTVSELVSLQKKPLPHNSVTKPILPAISISKPDQRLAFSSDNSTGFTFPISASSTAFSEPPTPSIMPSSSASGLQDEHSIPSYSFGSKRSTPAIVFSFPSTSSAAVPNDASDLKFSFGSEKASRLSFESVGKDAICY